MSLKSFHIFFLLIAVCFDLGMLCYAFFGEPNSVTEELKSYGVGLGIISVCLISYGIWFVTKKAPRIIV